MSSWLSQRRSETALPSLALTSPTILLLLNCTINTGRQANQSSTSAKHLSTAIVRDLYLTHTHLGSRPFHQLPRPSPLQNPCLPCMHAYLIICPRFTLRVAAVTEKNGGETDGHTHAHARTHTHTHMLGKGGRVQKNMGGDSCQNSTM